MLPPRYLLREDVVLRLVRELAPQRICEIGCGGGEMLACLAKNGYAGIGYDLSENAREHSRRVLSERGLGSFEISDTWPAPGSFDLVLLLEVIGYVDDAPAFLAKCRELLTDSGSFIISFVPDTAKYEPKLVGYQKSFAPELMRLHLAEAGFGEVRMLNYGFPLANALVGVFNVVHGIRLSMTAPGASSRETGLGHTSPLLQPARLISNRLTLKPFALLQRLFENSRRGPGFVACARRGSAQTWK